MCCGRLQNLAMAQQWPGLPVHHRIALGHQVAQPQLDRIQLEPDRKFVDQRLEGEGRLRPAGTAVRARTEPIGLDPVRAHVEGAPAVRPANQDGRKAFDPPFRVGPGVEGKASVKTGERPVRVRPDPDFDE